MKEFKAAVNPMAVIVGSLIGALVIVGGNWIFRDLERDDFTLAFGFIAGELTCLWVLWGRRDREGVR